ncbi:hypothetical protein [Virgibacillus sp. L01]|uniref:hypothetical protein n=1 Tax=Virgibacillus sp. L01 TaxID=3457429 RepID=UPI003FCFC104
MDKKLKKLKDQYKNGIPNSFTDRDKQGILTRIKKTQPKRSTNYFFPKALTAVVLTVILFIGVTMTTNHLGLTDGDKPAPNKEEQIASDDDDKHVVQLNKEIQPYITFNHLTAQPGDVVGDGSSEKMKVTDVEKHLGKTIITFKGIKQLTGAIYNDEQLTFVPDGNSIKDIPFSNKDIGNAVQFHFQNEDKIKKIFGLSTSFISIEDLTINIEQIQYIYSVNGSRIKLGVQNAVSSETELDFPRERYETTIELSDELLNVYRQYAQTLDDNLLKGLKPIEVFKLHYHAEYKENENVQYALYIKGKKRGTPDKDTYFNDPFFATDETMKQNARILYQKLLEVKTFEEIYLSDEEVIISFEFDGLTDNPMFRLIKNKELDVWKVGWMPMQ